MEAVQMKMKYTLSVLSLLMVLPMLTGCWTMAAAGAGAYGGYQMKKKAIHYKIRLLKKKIKRNQ